MPDAVTNASPLIVLAKADLLWLLPSLYGNVFAPSAVTDEIRAGPADDPMRRALASTPWLRQVRLDPPLSPLAQWQLGPGESEVIEYARLHPGLIALLDDRAARHAAEELSIEVHGTLRVLAQAVKHGHVASFLDGVDALRRSGLRVSETLIRGVQAEFDKTKE